jgi:hypothetical protein
MPHAHALVQIHAGVNPGVVGHTFVPQGGQLQSLTTKQLSGAEGERMEGLWEVAYAYTLARTVMSSDSGWPSTATLQSLCSACAASAALREALGST